MAANSDTTPFDRTIAQLIRLSDRVELRKKWCTKVCQDCQQLITPWPRRFGFAETGKSISEEKLSQGKKGEPESSGDCLSSSDLEHLRMIEDALKKAGKTRQVFQAKFEDSKVLPKTLTTEAAISRNSAIAKERLSYDSGDAIVKTFNSQATNSESDARLSESLSRRERNHSLPDINSNHTQKVRTATQANTNARKSSDVAVISQTALDSLRSSALSRPNSSRSVVAAKKSGGTTSSSAKYKPAHVTAPFLTTTQLGSGHRTSKKPLPAQKNVRSGQQNNLKSLSVASREQKTVSSVHVSSSSYAVSSARNFSSSLSSARGSSSSPAVTSACNSSSPSARSPVTSANDATSRSCGTDAVSSTASAVPTEIGEKVVRIVRCNNEIDSKIENDESSVKSARFHLLRDGSSLKLPSELGKALAANHRLREKLKASFTAKPRKLRDGESSSESFMLRLQKHMEDADPDVYSHSQNCHRHGNVNIWLQSLLDRIAALNISEETPASVIFQAQKIVEFVLHEFFGQQEILQSFVPRKLPPADRNTTGLNVRRKESMLHWFTSNPEDSNEEQLAPSARISYQTPDQLQTYMTLVHKVQLVQLQKFLLEEAGNQTIELLKQLNPNDRLFRELYRVSYSLICSLGQSFPSVVLNIDDDEDDVGVEEEKEEKKEKMGSVKDFDT